MIRVDCVRRQGGDFADWIRVRRAPVVAFLVLGWTLGVSSAQNVLAQAAAPASPSRAKTTERAGDDAEPKAARTREEIVAAREAEAKVWLDRAAADRARIAKKPVHIGDPSDGLIFVEAPEVMYHEHRDVIVENRGGSPRAVQIEFPNATNLACDEKLPVCETVQNREKKAICRIRPKNPKAGWDFPWVITLSYGKIGAIHKHDRAYELPYPPGYAYPVAVLCDSNHPREAVNAVDFAMPEDSLVCAMRDGKVIEVITTLAGPSPEHPDGNMICVEHKDGTVARYARLRLYGSLVSPGKTVKAGDAIGFSGQTGDAREPCLHVQIDAPTKLNVRSTVPITFRTKSDENARPVKGQVMQRPMADPELEGEPLNPQPAAGSDAAASEGG